LFFFSAMLREDVEVMSLVRDATPHNKVDENGFSKVLPIFLERHLHSFSFVLIPSMVILYVVKYAHKI